MDAALIALSWWGDSASRTISNNASATAPGRSAAIARLAPTAHREESDQKMDEMEAVMAKEDRRFVRIWKLEPLRSRWQHRSLHGRGALCPVHRLRMQILKLSRENTNVRSLTSRCGKAQVMMMCRTLWPALSSHSRRADRGSIQPYPVSPR